MYDGPKIIGGLVVFLAFITSPVWYNMAVGKSEIPKPELTEKAKKAKKCIESKEFMRAQHMDLLNQWRDKVVREQQRVYEAKSGKKYVMSLTNTCLDCHSNKDKFCDQCHAYSAVEQPMCFNCHNFEEKKGAK